MSKKKVIELLIEALPKDLKSDKLVNFLNDFAQTVSRATAEVKKNAEGKITHIKCQLSNLWFPVSEFKEAKTSIGYRPVNRYLVDAKRRFESGKKSLQLQITKQMTSGEIDAQEAVKKLQALEGKQFDVNAELQKLPVKGVKEL
jgi:hypothetical protein